MDWQNPPALNNNIGQIRSVITLIPVPSSLGNIKCQTAILIIYEYQYIIQHALCKTDANAHLGRVLPRERDLLPRTYEPYVIVRKQTYAHWDRARTQIAKCASGAT